jgi:hypothetical protein
VIRAQSPELKIALGEPGPWPQRAEPSAIVTAARSRAALNQPIGIAPADVPARHPRAHLERPSLSVPQR